MINDIKITREGPTQTLKEKILQLKHTKKTEGLTTNLKEQNENKKRRSQVLCPDSP